MKGKVNIVPIEYLKDMAYDTTGSPQELEYTDQIVGITKWFDGTVLDNIWKVKE
jgi:citrate lyase alpha subunit